MMAALTLLRMTLVFWAFLAGVLSAPTMPASEADDVAVSQDMMTSEVQCDVAGCDYDLQLYCLANGVIVMGSCSLKNTLCTDGRRNTLELAQTWDDCFLATYTVHRPQQMVMVKTDSAADSEAKNVAMPSPQDPALHTPDAADIPVIVHDGDEDKDILTLTDKGQAKTSGQEKLTGEETKLSAGAGRIGTIGKPTATGGMSPMSDEDLTQLLEEQLLQQEFAWPPLHATTSQSKVKAEAAPGSGDLA